MKKGTETGTVGSIAAHGVRDKPVDSEFIDMMKAQSVWYIPTIALDYTNFVFAEQPLRPISRT